MTARPSSVTADYLGENEVLRIQKDQSVGGEEILPLRLFLPSEETFIKCSLLIYNNYILQQIYIVE